MLRDELLGLEGIVEKVTLVNPACDPFMEGFVFENFKITLTLSIKKVRWAWNAAAFSRIPDYSLKRYFHFHLEGIRELLDTLPCLVTEPRILNLLKTGLQRSLFTK